MKNIVVHYSEIGTKGKNRDFFEKQLIENLKLALKGKVDRVYRRYGRIICELKKNSDPEEIRKILELIPGISSFSFAVKAELDIAKISEEALKLAEKNEFNTFAVETKRSNKQFPLKSPEVNQKVAEKIITRLNKKVDYRHPEIKIYLEVGEKEVFISVNKHFGIGGLPVNTGGKVISSLSGGIDSPVASFLLMKRGCQVIFVHIHNQNQTSKAVKTKIMDLVKQLTKIQLKSKLYLVPFEKIQKQIIMNIPSKIRMIVYRRFMLKIINQISQKEKAKGIVTGDSIGQVASQTIENLECIYDSSELPIFNPLIGMNKEEIVNLAKKIGTYELSIIPYPDCCSFMIAKHPETKGKLKEITEAEKFIENQEQLIQESVTGSEIMVDI